MTSRVADFDDHLDAASSPSTSGGRNTRRNVFAFVAVFLFVAIVLLLVILGVTAATLAYYLSNSSSSQSQPTTAPATSNSALGLPDIEKMSWSDIVTAASGQTVEFWASSISNYDVWVDEFLTPMMRTLFNVRIVRVPLSDAGAQEATQRIQSELAVGNRKNGSVGLIWTNGPDFYLQRSQNLLYGPFATKLPNAVNFNFESAAIAVDFGQPTAGFEFPYCSAQVTFFYNPACGVAVQQLPESMDELVTWAVQNPGKFTYANPGGANGDYTGSAFIRHFLYEFGGGYEKLKGSYSDAVYKRAAPAAFAKLRTLDSAVLKNNITGASIYPTSQFDVDNLFATGQICFTISYDPDHAGQMIHTAQSAGSLNWPANVTAFLPRTGTIGNVNFVAIATNTRSLFGSLVTANFIGSMGATFSRRSIVPPGIGTVQPYNPHSTAVVEGLWNVPLSQIASFPETPTQTQLESTFVPEIDANFALQMQLDWEYCISQKLPTASGTGGSGISCT